jgi:periplasmic copper chaperone A
MRNGNLPSRGSAVGGGVTAGKKHSRRCLAALIFLPALVCSVVSAAAELVIKDAWVKLAPKGTGNHAAYMQLLNTSAKPITIVAISTPKYERVLLHQTKIVNDRVQMEHVESLDIPAKSTLTLTPGAAHLMLIGSRQPQKSKELISFIFVFGDGTRQEFQAITEANHE